MTDDEKPSEKLYLVIGMAEQEEQEIMKVCLTKKEAISYAKRNLTDYEGVPIGESDATDMSNCIQEIEIPHKALLSAALDALDVVEKESHKLAERDTVAWAILTEALARARAEVKKKHEEGK